jgi:multiple sugar transport system substrate-binding protein
MGLVVARHGGLMRFHGMSTQAAADKTRCHAKLIEWFGGRKPIPVPEDAVQRSRLGFYVGAVPGPEAQANYKKYSDIAMYERSEAGAQEDDRTLVRRVGRGERHGLANGRRASLPAAALKKSSDAWNDLRKSDVVPGRRPCGLRPVQPPDARH